MVGLPDWLRREQVTHVEVFAARAGEVGQWPAWAAPELVKALAAAGIEAPWRHQVEGASLAFEGVDVVMATGTGSGKSLAYLLPALTAVLDSPKARLLYLAPTKALAVDQLRAINAMELPGIRAEALDGDTVREQRDWIRQFANVILTNPDLLHHTLLPQHHKWASLLRQMRYVVVDESHSYRGVFGAHVAHVLRRLRRLTAERPVFILASATSGDPAASASKLVGRPVKAVVEDAAPRGAATFALWEPPLLPGRGELPRPRPAEQAPSTLDTLTGPSAPAAPAVTRRGERAEASLGRWTAGGTHADGAIPSGTLAGGQSPTGSSGAPSGSWPPGATAAWPPPDASPVRRSALRETGDLLADAVLRGVRTLAFVPSRRGAEVVASQAKRALDEVAPELASQIAAYRAGYLPEERRALEQALTAGELTGLATTNALELGIDVSGLDVVLLSGYPGTRAAMWQRAGRAGRAGRDGMCVLIAKDDPLDTYLVHHPEALFHKPVEATVFDPGNPYVLVPHLCAAAAEKPLTVEDLELFGASRALVDRLVADGTLRSRPSGWYWTHSQRPTLDLRGTGDPPISVIEASTGRLIGTAGSGSAHHQLHPGAVYTHQGSVYVVQHLDLEDAVAMVEADNPPHSTHARDVTSLDVLDVLSYVDAGPIGVFLGEVEVTSQVISFQRRRLDTGEVLGTWPLDLPPRTLRTVAVWVTFAESTLSGVEDVPGALHAAEHAAIGLLPLVASCDRWDIGGLSTARHPDTDAPTIFVYDGHPGGAGFAERAYEMAQEWFAATRDTVQACGCELGCPGCVQSPKCGNGNNPLDKRGAVTALSRLLTHLGQRSSVDHVRLRALRS
ncbi:MAG TPA: DEAD/DEAH box helicase [Candidatus Limnocylindrales bacterium]|nr:DEAD/DEAH box helicase [Candidatus Limnocylindrales bacterium]